MPSIAKFSTVAAEARFETARRRLRIRTNRGWPAEWSALIVRGPKTAFYGRSGRSQGDEKHGDQQHENGERDADPDKIAKPVFARNKHQRVRPG